MTTAQEVEVDVTVEKHGSLFIFQPLTAAANIWITANVPDGATWHAGGLVVEPRYAPNLAQGMLNDGLNIK